MSSEPFYYLNKSVRVSVLESKRLKSKFIKKSLKNCGIYRLEVLNSREQLNESLHSPFRTHIIFMSVSDLDFHGEELFFLKKLSSSTNFFLFANKTDSVEKIFMAGKLGAVYLTDNTKDIDRNFLKTLNATMLKTVINPLYNKEIYTLKKSTDILIDKSPGSVNSWALMQNITDRALRYIWKDNLGANTKIILELSNILKQAILYYEKIDLESHNIEASVKSGSYEKLENFFHLHRRVILDYIEYNPIIPGKS